MVGLQPLCVVASAGVLHPYRNFGSGAGLEVLLAFKLACEPAWPLQTPCSMNATCILGDHFYPVIFVSPVHWLGLGAAGLLMVQALASGGRLPFHRFVARRAEPDAARWSLGAL